jgi:predicted metal-dependent peptidase
LNDSSAVPKLESALSMVETLFPNAVHILAAMDVRLDDRVSTAAVTASGRMLVSPAFLDALTVHQVVFIVAHELYHILYGAFDRFDSETPPYRRWLVNVAHDFLINDMLEKKFAEAEFSGARSGTHLTETPRRSKSAYIPREGLFWTDFAASYKRIVGKDQPSLETFTLESLVLELEQIRNELPAGNSLDRMLSAKRSGRVWNTPIGDLLGRLEKKDADKDANTDGTEVPKSDGSVADAGRGHDFSNLLGDHPELLTEREEAELFPEETAIERHSRKVRIKDAKELSSARDVLHKALDVEHGVSPGDGNAVVHALEGVWATPWECALQKWLDDTEPPVRSWAKASRRAGNRTDVVMPGRSNESRILNIVVDTSGSMVDELPAVFGMIQSFGKTSGVRAVRIVQCDAGVTGDDLVDIDDLKSFEVKGFGGSDMSPGLLHLAEDPTVEAAMVITDGDIEYPPKDSVPFEVLWSIIYYDDEELAGFNPGYGRVVGIPVGPIQCYGR